MPGDNPGYVEATIQAVAGKSRPLPWICAGDYNMPPGTVPQDPSKHVYIADCGEATHTGGKELDYAYFGYIDGKVLQRVGATCGTQGVSDHAPVEIEFNFK